MKRHTISLSPADLDTIHTGGRITIPADDGTKVVLSNEPVWCGPAVDPQVRELSTMVYRVGLSSRHLDDLRFRGHASAITSDGNTRLVFTVDAEAVAR